MSERVAVSMPPTSPARAHGQLVLRRCACGGVRGLDGECDACRARRLQRSAITVAPTTDPYEREADRFAESVAGNDARLHRASDAPAPEPTPPVEADVRSLAGGGVPLPAEEREYFEPRLGVDLGAVRIHTDPRAASSARALAATAYTFGTDIAFARGRYAPGTTAGRRLLAHELAHVAQRGNDVVQRQANEESRGRGVPDDDVPADCRRSSVRETGSGPSASRRYRVRVCVDTNELFVEELQPPHGRVFHSLVVTGGEGTPTPIGTYRLGPWERDYTTPKWGSRSCTPWSERPGWNVFGPWISRFHGGYFLHGTLFPSVASMPWINVAGLFGGSHGCIRMNNVDLETLHDGLLSNPAGTTIIIGSCATPAEATSEVRLGVPVELGGGGAGFEVGYRRFTPTLLGRGLQPFVGGGVGTEGLGVEAGLTAEQLAPLHLYLEGRVAVRTEWFQRVEAGAGVEAGLSLGKSGSVRLGVAWETWQTLGEEERRNVVRAAVGFRF